MAALQSDLKAANKEVEALKAQLTVAKCQVSLSHFAATYSTYSTYST